MPHLDAQALETDPDGCALLASVLREPTATSSRELRPTVAVALLRFLRRRHAAARRVSEVLAERRVVDLRTIAASANLSLRQARGVVHRLELHGLVLVQTTSDSTVVRAIDG